MIRSWLAPVLLAGLLPLSFDAFARWPVATDWIFPVGGIRDVSAEGPGGDPGYATTRNVGGPHGHQGADLSNRRAGGEVRAAAMGLVVFAGARVPDNGYGTHVVLAHRLADGKVAYSVYAHLISGSLAVKPGETVAIGTCLGRVGSTGVATSAHLHFEVRIPSDPQERWEKARVVDPLAFVGHRLLVTAADSANAP